MTLLRCIRRVSLTYRVKSAHKVKLTDKQLLQWMFPILLVMLIYLGTWTLSAPPTAEQIRDQAGLRFKQCSYNWWDHSLAIGNNSVHKRTSFSLRITLNIFFFVTGVNYRKVIRTSAEFFVQCIYEIFFSSSSCNSKLTPECFHENII